MDSRENTSSTIIKKLNGNARFLDVQKATSRTLLRVIAFERRYAPARDAVYYSKLKRLTTEITELTLLMRDGIKSWWEIRSDYAWVYSEINSYISKLRRSNAERETALRVPVNI
jgi:hypothetical protein